MSSDKNNVIAGPHSTMWRREELEALALCACPRGPQLGEASSCPNRHGHQAPVLCGPVSPGSRWVLRNKEPAFLGIPRSNLWVSYLVPKHCPLPQRPQMLK